MWIAEDAARYYVSLIITSFTLLLLACYGIEDL
jgi:hypothetical protein